MFLTWVIFCFIVLLLLLLIPTNKFVDRIVISVLVIALSSLLGATILQTITCGEMWSRNQECKIIAVPKEVVEK